MSTKTLIIDDATARKIYPSAPAEIKAILEDSYTKGFFSQDIKDRIKTFEDACEYNNTNPKSRRFTVGTRNQIYQERVAEIVKALNEGWMPNYNDSSEYKYTPYFYLNAPSFRFYGSDCTFAVTIANAGTGSRFALKSRSLSDYAGQQFIKEYEYWMTPISHSQCSGDDTTRSTSSKPFIGDMKAWEAYITPRIKSFENACSEVGEDPEDEKFTEGERDEIAYRKLKVITKSLNNGWVPDWNNGSQYKWYPWFYMAPSFRFNDSFYSGANAGTGTGSRLRFASEALASYAGKQFLSLYEDYMTL